MRLKPETQTTTSVYGDGGDDYHYDGNPTTNLKEALQMERWKGAVGTFLAKVCSTIGLRTVPVEWLDTSSIYYGESQGIAYTDGESIFLNPEVFREAFGKALTSRNVSGTATAMAALKGAAYHELAHIKYTPRSTMRPTKDVRDLVLTNGDNRYWLAYNALEDQRIETRFILKYAPSRDYFIPLVAEHILSSNGRAAVTHKEDAEGMAFLLVYGRRYLGSKVIRAAYDAHVEWLAKHGLSLNPQTVMDVIDSYLTLTFPTDADVAVDLIKEYAHYLNTCMGAAYGNSQTENNPGQFSPTGNHDSISKGKADHKSDQLEDWEEWLAKNNPFTSDQEGDATVKGNGDGDDEGEGEGEGEGDSEGDGDIADEDSDDIDGQSGDGEGTSAGGHLAKALRNAAADSSDRTEGAAQSDLKSVRRLVDTQRRDSKPDLQGSWSVPVSGSMATGSRRIQDTITAIRAEGEAVWEVSQHGKLNTRAAMAARGAHFDIFDQWVDSGDDANSFEVVILLDQSGSMHGFCQNQASAAMWTIRHACKALDIPVTVIGYDDYARMLFRPGDPISNTNCTVVKSDGNTEPEVALEWALSIFNASSAAHKLLFSITDGQWAVSTPVRTVMAELKRIGVHTTLVQQFAETVYYDSNSPTGVSNRILKSKPPADKYLHDRVLQVGYSAQELPKELCKALSDISREVNRGV